MIDRPGIIAFPSRDAMASRLATLCQAVVAGSIEEKGEAVLALSGGSTPAALYSRLGAMNPAHWAKTTVTLVDERWVAPDEDGSNEAFVRDALRIDEKPPFRDALGEPARPVGAFHGLWREGLPPRDAAAAATRDLRDVAQSIDLAILGMGTDGHTASWFPHAEGLAEALSTRNQAVVHVRAQPSEATGPHLDRLTLTLGAVASARVVILLINGEEKRRAFEQARAAGAIEDMPVRAILDARPDMWVCWAR